MHANFTAAHSAPIFTTVIAEALARYFDPTVTVKMNLHPFPSTYRQSMQLASYNLDLVVTFILLAVPFIPAAFITFVVREKETRSKQQQMVST